MPPAQALGYFAPKLSIGKRELRVWLNEWSNDPLVIDALNAFNKGEWHELDPEQRLQIALDKHDAEQAYFLYHNNFVHATDDLVLTKMRTARESLRLRLSSEQEKGRDDAFRTVLREIMEGKLGPPQFTDVGAEIGESVPAEKVDSRIKRLIES